MRTYTWLLSVCFVALAFLVLISCGGGKHGGGLTSRIGENASNVGASGDSPDTAGTWQSQINPTRTLSIEQAIEEARTYTPPANVTNDTQFDPLVFEQLRNELIKQLEAKRERGISSLPDVSDRNTSAGGRDDFIDIPDLVVMPLPDGTNEIRFSEILQGDYDSSGEVGIPDITPIALNYGHKNNDGESDDALDSKVDGDGDGEVGIPDITPIANNYLMTSPATGGAADDGYDVWRMPADGNGDAELMTTVTADIEQAVGDNSKGYGETRIFSAIDNDPVRGVSFVREISNYGNITVQREVLDAPEDGFVPKTGHCTGREISSIDSEGNGYANGDYVYYISPHDDETPDSPPQFAVTVEHQNDFRFAGAPASCQIVVKSWGELVPVSYTMDWGVPDSDYTPAPIATADPLYQFTYTYTRPGIYCPVATVTGTVRGVTMSITQCAAPVIVEADVPYAPTGLSVSQLGNDVQLNWDVVDPDDHDGFRVYYSMKRGDSRPILLGETGQTANTFQTNLNDMLLYVTADHPVFFKVSAFREGDGTTTRELESKFSNEVKWPLDVQAPTIEIIDFTDDNVDFSWVSVANTQDYEVEGYRLYKRTSLSDTNPVMISGTDPLPSTQTTFTYPTLASETTLYFFARTVSSIGESGRSNEVMWNRELPNPPVVSNPTATPGNNSVTLNWESPTDDGNGAIENIRISYGTKSDHTDEQDVIELSGITTEYTMNDSGQKPLANDTRYYFWITTVRAGKTASQRVSAKPFNTPPTAGFDTDSAHPLPYEGDPGATIAFESTSTDSDGSIVKYEWDFDGDGLFSETNNGEFGAIDNPEPSHQYNEEGSFAPALKVTDDDGGTDTYISTELITIGTGNPVAVTDMTAPMSGNSPLTVNFSAEGSYDPDGEIVEYAWKFETEDTYEDYTAELGIIAHEYTVIGTHTATLRVTDDDGKKAYKSVQIRVNDPPYAEGGASPQSGTKPLTVDFNATASYDSDGSIVKWEWDFNGDGTYDSNSASSGDAQYTYIDHGDYDAKLRITDSDGATVTDTVPIHVNAPPVANCDGAPKTGYRPLTVNFNATGSNDPDGSITLYEWDFQGDGTYDWESDTNGDTSHDYTGPEGLGTFNARLRVTDNEGIKATKSVQITVNNSPPVADLASNPDPAEGLKPLSVDFNALGSTDTDGTIAKYEWDWEGDGTYDLDSGTDGTQSHNYPNHNDYTATVRVTDSDGDMDTAGVPVHVNAPPVADLEASPTEGDAPLTVNFDASGSSDPFGDIVNYEWDFDGDGLFNEAENGEDLFEGSDTASYEYTDSGDYTAAVRVTDDDGATNTDTVYVIVNEPPIWHIETVDSANEVGKYTSIALASNGYVHISYWDKGNYDLKYAVFDGTSWVKTTVDSTGDVGECTSLALDSDDHPHISYSDWSNHNLKYAHFNGTSWVLEIADSTGDIGSWTSIVLDSNDLPHISYLDYNNQSDGNLKYAYYNGSIWNSETVDIVGDVGWFTSITIDSNNYPHISYRDNTSGDLKYAYFDGNQWQITVADGPGDVGQYSSICLDSGSNPNISYFDVGNGDLKFAKYNGVGWETETVDNSVPVVGEFSSLELDSNHHPHICYWSEFDDRDLKYAKWNGTSWEIVTVDASLDQVGSYCSLALDANDLPHISYQDYTNTHLKYAWFG